jgi:hypothetical protein
LLSEVAIERAFAESARKIEARPTAGTIQALEGMDALASLMMLKYESVRHRGHGVFFIGKYAASHDNQDAAITAAISLANQIGKSIS